MTLPIIIFMFQTTLGSFLSKEGNFLLGLINTSMLLLLLFTIVLQNTIAWTLPISWLPLCELWIYFNNLTSFMLCLILVVSLTVQIYSFFYMIEDPFTISFFAYLTLFTWCMMVLCSASSLLQLYMGWEGVGICSFFLISFWGTRLSALKCAFEAMSVNKLGDMSFIIAIFICMMNFGSVHFWSLSLIPESLKEFIALLLLLACAGKSAQLGLHIWLPEAMEGPTPVSALIHAATMVTAGIFLILRCSLMFQNSPLASFTLMIMGGCGSFLFSLFACFQNDLKKIMAWSTCAQLSYMSLACGLGLFEMSFFHLFNHGFFKALLFLGAGCIMHSSLDEQNLAKMGLNLSPLTALTMMTGSCALAGFPFLTGFYSKDLIIELGMNNMLINMSIIGAFLSTFYSCSLMFNCFFQLSMGPKKVIENYHSSPVMLNILLLILGILSVMTGFTGNLLVWSSVSFISNNYLILMMTMFASFCGVYMFVLLHSKLQNMHMFTNTLYFSFFANTLMYLPFFSLTYSKTHRLIDNQFLEKHGLSGLLLLFISFIQQKNSSSFIRIFMPFLLVLLMHMSFIFAVCISYNSFRPSLFHITSYFMFFMYQLHFCFFNSLLEKSLMNKKSSFYLTNSS